jgi:hypothetical protein
MYAKRADTYDTLPREQRALVLYAHLANQNTWSGGASALRRADRSPIPDATSVVAEVYSTSSGKVPDSLDAWECGECGCAHYGRDAADTCCSPSEDDFSDDDSDSDD